LLSPNQSHHIHLLSNELSIWREAKIQLEKDLLAQTLLVKKSNEKLAEYKRKLKEERKNFSDIFKLAIAQTKKLIDNVVDVEQGNYGEAGAAAVEDNLKVGREEEKNEERVRLAAVSVVDEIEASIIDEEFEFANLSNVSPMLLDKMHANKHEQKISRESELRLKQIAMQRHMKKDKYQPSPNSTVANKYTANFNSKLNLENNQFQDFTFEKFIGHEKKTNDASPLHKQRLFDATAKVVKSELSILKTLRSFHER